MEGRYMRKASWGRVHVSSLPFLWHRFHRSSKNERKNLANFCAHFLNSYEIFKVRWGEVDRRKVWDDSYIIAKHLYLLWPLVGSPPLRGPFQGIVASTRRAPSRGATLRGVSRPEQLQTSVPNKHSH